MVKGILFDMDGILFDSERPCVNMEREIAAEMGFEMPEEVFRLLPGRSTAETGALLSETFGPAFDYERFKAILRPRLEAYYAEHGLQLLPAVEETLELLQSRGYPMAVASSSTTKSVTGRLEQSGLARFFSHAIGVDMAGGVSKPEPDLFLLAAKALGLPPGQCAAIEDSYNGIRAGAAAGCVTVMVPDLLPPTEETGRLAAATLASLAQLPGWLEAHNRAGQA